MSARAIAVLVGAAVTALAAGCGTEPGGADSAPKITIVIGENRVHPAYTRVPVGTRVTFFNRADAPNTAETDNSGPFELDREAMARRGAFDVHTLYTGEAETVTLTRPGRYEFHSSLGPPHGVIEVVARDTPRR